MTKSTLRRNLTVYYDINNLEDREMLKVHYVTYIARRNTYSASLEVSRRLFAKIMSTGKILVAAEMHAMRTWIWTGVITVKGTNTKQPNAAIKSYVDTYGGAQGCGMPNKREEMH